MNPHAGVPVSESTGVPGWETVAEERELMRITRQYVPHSGVIVELGGEYGRSAAQFAKACAGKHNVSIHTVDLFPMNHPLVGDLLFAWRSNIAEAKVTDHHILTLPHRGKTTEVASTWNTPIDLLFIDAGHSYAEVVTDIVSWVKHVKPGGVVAFHDYAKDDGAHEQHYEVKRAVDEWHAVNKWERHDAPDSLVWFVKPKKEKEIITGETEGIDIIKDNAYFLTSDEIKRGVQIIDPQPETELPPQERIDETPKRTTKRKRGKR